MIAYASSLDQGGVIAPSVLDAALVLDCFAGPDSRDSTCSDRAWPLSATGIDTDVSKMVLGIPHKFIRDLDTECQESFATALRALESRGCRLADIELPHAHYGVSAYYVIASAEASANLARYDGVRYGHRCEAPRNLADLYERSRTEGFGAEVKRRILIGVYALSVGYHEACYRQAQCIRRLIRDDFDAVFDQVDAVATPTTPTPAFPLGAKIDDPVSMYRQDVYTVLANMAGLPALSVPAPPVAGLPYGLQLQGAHGADPVLLKMGHALQSHTDWHRTRPSMALPQGRNAGKPPAPLPAGEAGR